jgi:hypothetical protein
MPGQINMFGEEEKLPGADKKTKLIISASRRTDIPAFYYDWLQASLAAGHAVVPNPRFPDRKYVVDLNPSNIHSIVLWSKDFGKVLKDHGRLVDYNLYFQYTINNYSKFLEPNVPEYGQSLDILKGLLLKYKPEQFNIRFDPVIISSLGETTPTPESPETARLLAFERLCRDLKALGMDNCRITTSYIALYPHVRKRLDKCGLDMMQLDESKLISFFSSMAETAQKFGYTLYSCASPVLQQAAGIKRGHCIDGELLEKLFGGRVSKSKDSGQRAACGCTGSRDIGIYSKDANGMKCMHGCKYCYVMGDV